MTRYITPGELKSLVKDMEKRLPVLHSRCYPRHYLHNDKHHSPKILTPLAASLVLHRSNGFKVNTSGGVDDVMQHAYLVTSDLIRAGVPTFFVTESLLSAIEKTNLPDDVSYNDLKWPFDAVMFVMPRGALKSPAGIDVCVLAVSHAEAGRPHYINSATSIPSESEEFGCAETDPITTRRGYISTIATAENCETWAWGHRTTDYSGEPIDSPLGSFATDPYFGFFIPNDNTMELERSKLPEVEATFARLHTKIALQLLLVLSARPDLLEPSVVAQRGKSNAKSGPKPDLWKPNFLGLNYAIRKEAGDPQGGSHASPRSHYRRGHWRLYRVGEGRKWKSEKTVWIEPTAVMPQ